MIKLTAEQINKLHDNQYAMNPNIVEGFEGWYIEADKDSGEFFKSFMTNFEILLYDNNDKLRAIAIGGDYAQDEYYFNEDLEFEEVEDTDLTRFNAYLIEIANNAMSVGSDLAEITVKLTEISQYVSKLTKEK